MFIFGAHKNIKLALSLPELVEGVHFVDQEFLFLLLCSGALYEREHTCFSKFACMKTLNQ